MINNKLRSSVATHTLCVRFLTTKLLKTAI